jgi:hypothetical protein
MFHEGVWAQSRQVCLLGNSSPKPWFNALAQGVSKRPGLMARGATASAEASASGKGARIHKHLVLGIAHRWVDGKKRKKERKKQRKKERKKDR